MVGMSEEEAIALPVTVDLDTAGRAFGMGRTKSHELARADEFPCPVKRFGSRYLVLRADLLAALGIDALMVSRPVEVSDPKVMPVDGQDRGLSGSAVRALYEALMAAARVLADHGAQS